MTLKITPRKEHKILMNVNPTELKKIFSYIPIKTSIKLLQINKKLSSLIGLSIDDYFLEKNYQKIVIKSQGNSNYIFENSFKFYNEQKSKGLSTKPMEELTADIIKYLNYLYSKKIIKSIKIFINGNVYNKWMYFRFSLELIRNIKNGIIINISPNLNFRFYELIKDAILNLEEIKSFDFHSFKNEENINKNYFGIVDWSKVKCLDFSNVIKHRFPICNAINYFPKNMTFSKLIIDENKNANLRKICDFAIFHANHIEKLKIFNLSNYESIIVNKPISDFFKEFKNLKILKLINCDNLLFSNFLLFFKNNLSLIEKLILDKINVPDDIDISKNYNDMIKNVFNLTRLEKFEIDFVGNASLKYIFNILSIIINRNKNIKQLKISFPLKKSLNKKNSDNASKISSNFINFDSFNSKNKENFMKKEEKLNIFIDLITAISSLKNLFEFRLITPMNDMMTNCFNDYFNVGESLRNLEIIHSGNLDINQLFNKHPNLDNINFKLICEESNINIEHINIKYNNFKMCDFQYDLPQRSWNNIILNYYPITGELMDLLSRCKKSIKQLKLNQSINFSGKSNSEVFNTLVGCLK
jgi:hypothetical protein